MGDALCLVGQGVSEGTLVPPSTTHEDDEEEVSQFSEGQLIPASSQSYSEDSEMSEESIAEGKNMQNIFLGVWGREVAGENLYLLGNPFCQKKTSIYGTVLSILPSVYEPTLCCCCITSLSNQRHKPCKAPLHHCQP